MDMLQPCCNRDSTEPNKVGFASEPKCWETAQIGGLPNKTERSRRAPTELTRRRTLVRAQHRPLRKSSILQVKHRTSRRNGKPILALLLQPYCNPTA